MRKKAVPLVLAALMLQSVAFAEQKEVVQVPKDQPKYELVDKDGNRTIVNIEDKKESIELEVKVPDQSSDVIIVPKPVSPSGGGGGGGGGSVVTPPVEPPIIKEPEVEKPLPPVTPPIKPPVAISFKDINNHWAKKDILQAAELGFITGFPDGTFQPNKTISKAEFAVMLNGVLEKANKKEVKGVNQPFLDVPRDSWFDIPVRSLFSRGNISLKSYPEKKLNPNNPILREELVAWLSPEVPQKNGEMKFKDIKDIKLKDEVKKVYNNGLISGYPDGTFKPSGNTTRAEATSMMIRLWSLININKSKGE